MLRLCLSASKPFTSCNSLNTIIVWGQWSDLCRERGQGLPPHPLSLCVPDHSKQDGAGWGCSQWAAAHGPLPRPAFPFLPARAPRSTYPSGTRSSLLQAAFVCLSQNSQPTFFCFLNVSEESPSQRAQPSMTFPPWNGFLPAWPLEDQQPRRITPSVNMRPSQRVAHSRQAHYPNMCPGHPSQTQVPVGSSPASAAKWLPLQRVCGHSGSWVLGIRVTKTKSYVVYKLPWVFPQFVSLILLAFHSSTWPLPRPLLWERGKNNKAPTRPDHGILSFRRQCWIDFYNSSFLLVPSLSSTLPTSLRKNKPSIPLKYHIHNSSVRMQIWSTFHCWPFPIGTENNHEFYPGTTWEAKTCARIFMGQSSCG